MGIFSRWFSSRKGKENLNQGLYRSKVSLLQKLKGVFGSGSVWSPQDLEKVEEILISSDIGVSTSLKIVAGVSKSSIGSESDLKRAIKEEILKILPKNDMSKSENDIQSKPHVIMMIGVNGVGKTTTIAKLAAQYSKSGLNVVLGAADTFRAAAVDQLAIWADKIGVNIVRQDTGADPASVAFDTIQSALSKKTDVVLIDTAGRLHNKTNLMKELGKMERVIQKILPDAPHETLLVLDGATGQNALQQAREFGKIVPLTGLVVTKLDGTSKGGIVIAIADQMNIPIKYIGVGEQVEDLQPFDPEAFAESLFAEDLDSQ